MNAQSSSSAIQLYGVVLSGHTHRVQLFLNLLGLPFEFINVNLASGENHSAAFLAMSPFGEVPVLRDGDVVLTDSSAILVYLASRYDRSGRWLPRDPVAAATVQRWLSNASGKIAYGPCAVRLVKLFGKSLDYDTAAAISLRVLAAMELELSEKKFALGDQVSIADVAAFSYIEHVPEGGISLAPYPHIRAWLDRVSALPGFVAMPASARPAA
ncbi:glutathione S-transferase [Herbaspirillum sp. Sphag1AN]|uniref:glutathione S-transferase family protein n=1 Tax=unclassified Herbaspirillum TaxID=2624150 RepID=UPI001619E4E5|nr:MULTISPECIES: glutathione S-transferase [unclassified Herbaspirillum]MBB3213071.1 glutathione S-transferase [Herbaspirillum sp. Sphag1AN]MBB3246268.1 glutathione S-transferase [Herbaspirillum sp. Sphag64]